MNIKALAIAGVAAATLISLSQPSAGGGIGAAIRSKAQQLVFQSAPQAVGSVSQQAYQFIEPLSHPKQSGNLGPYQR